MRKFHISKITGEIQRILPVLIFIFLGVFSGSGENKYEHPDFAFPEKAALKSDSLLHEALNTGNDLMALRWAMNLMISNVQRNGEESTTPNYQLVTSLIDKLKAEYRQIGWLLEANLLSDIYLQNRGLFDSRKLPLENPYPSQPDEWSGEMFKESIFECIEKGTEDLEKNSKIPVSELEILLTKTKEAEKYGMSVADFQIFKSVEILRNFTGDSQKETIPFYPEHKNMSKDDRAKEKTLDLLEDLISRYSEDKSLIKGLAIQTYSTYLPNSEKKIYLEEQIKKLYGTEGEGIILYALWEEGNSDSKELYSRMKNWLDLYPNICNSSQIKYALSIISNPQIEIELPNISLPGEEIEGNVTMSNVNKGYLLVYKVDKNETNLYDDLFPKKLNISKTPVDIIEITNNDTIPFAYTSKIKFKGLNEGLYAVIPSLTKKLPKDWYKTGENYNTFRVSEISLLTSWQTNEKDSGKVYVVKGKNQAPVEGALVEYFSYDNYKKPKGRALTDSEGCVTIPTGYYRITATYGRSIAKTEGGYNYYPEIHKESSRLSILTDLQIYLPGDTVRFVAVGWQPLEYGDSLIRNREIIVELRDANFKTVDELSLVLDNDGRASGVMKIPAGRLLGNYQLLGKYKESSELYAGSANINVEEYRLPAFMVTISQNVSDEKDRIKFSGKAVTFSGMPVSDAEGRIEIEFQPWRWGYFSANPSYTMPIKTDIEGDFEIDLPINNLKGTIFAQGRYILKAEVTSTAGETEISAPNNFYLSELYSINPALDDKIRITGSLLNISVPVYDVAGLPVKREVEYEITNLYDSTFNIKGRFESPVLTLDTENLKSGKYKLSFRCENDSVSTDREVVFWRSDDNLIPYPVTLWIPENEYSYSTTGENVEITFGSYSDSYLLMTVSDGEKIKETRWLEPSDTLHRVILKTSGDSPYLFVTLAGMHEFESMTGQIRIVPQESLEKMRIISESFREKLTAGDKEKWQFKILVGNKVAPYANVIAVATDKALNSLMDFKWNLHIMQPSPYCRFYVRNNGRHLIYVNKSFGKNAAYSAMDFVIPSWNTYGFPWVAHSMFLSGMPVMYRSMKVMNAMADKNAEIPVEEAAEDSEEVTTGISFRESEMESDKDIELRPVEMPVFLFRPNLKANGKGEVELEFETPNFNTTWQFQIAAYDDKLKNCVQVFDAVASKEVMVKTNLPSFLRTGDRTMFVSTIYNNSEEKTSIGGKIEVCDGSGRILKLETFKEEEVEPYGNRLISLEYQVPDTLNEIRVRTYGYGDLHTDGEEGRVMVLPSSTPVIESTTFYLRRNEAVKEIKVPKLQKNANVTLKYCDNPLWEILLSLPSPRMEKGRSSLSLMRSLYSMTIGQDLFESYPEISTRLFKIMASNDSTLTESNLEKDGNLKLSALEATPWLNNAGNETERIRSLRLYQDKDFIIQHIGENTDRLMHLQNSDGGWSWFEGMQSSPYITKEILMLLGSLNECGLFSRNLELMANKGTAFCEKEFLRAYKKDKTLNIESSLEFLYALSMLPVKESKDFRKFREIVTDSINKNWRYMDLRHKAMAYPVLYQSTQFRETAKLIESSLTEYIGQRMSVEDELFLLRLFNKTKENEASEIIQEKILLQKETQDWNGSTLVAGVLYEIIKKTGRGETEISLPEIYIHGNKLEFSHTQSLTGNYTINLEPGEVSGKKITIKRGQGLPAWGGVVSQYIAPIKEVKAATVENLRIEKKIYLIDENGNLKETDHFKQGDKIRVSLTIVNDKDMDYVEIRDNLPACIATQEDISGMIWEDGISFYREMGKENISFFTEHLPAGVHIIGYDCNMDRSGEYSSGISEVQSLYAPQQVSHTCGGILTVRPS